VAVDALEEELLELVLARVELGRETDERLLRVSSRRRNVLIPFSSMRRRVVATRSVHLEVDQEADRLASAHARVGVGLLAGCLDALVGPQESARCQRTTLARSASWIMPDLRPSSTSWWS